MRTFNHEHAINSRFEYAAVPDGLLAPQAPYRMIVETDLPIGECSQEYHSRMVSDLEIKASDFARSEGIAEVVFVRKAQWIASPRRSEIASI